jgi:hypothetical protein
MDPDALDALPRAYRVGLQLRALGADDALIADCLDIDVAGVVTLLAIGDRKLEQIQRVVLTIDEQPVTSSTPSSDRGNRFAREERFVRRIQ